MNKWDERYLRLAAHVSTWSKDPSTVVGAVIVRDNAIISLGFNGFPKGVADTPERLWDRETKLGMIVHAEMNALIHAKQGLHGATMYTWPMMSCSHCATAMIQAGITRHVAPKCAPEEYPKWGKSHEITRKMFAEVGIQLVEI